MGNGESFDVDAPTFQRTGRTSELGKLDDRVEAVFRIEPLVRAEFLRKCALLGKNETEVIRDMYRVAAVGKRRLKDSHGDYLDAVGEMLGIARDE